MLIVLFFYYLGGATGIMKAAKKVGKVGGGLG